MNSLKNDIATALEVILYEVKVLKKKTSLIALEGISETLIHGAHHCCYILHM